MDYHANNDMQKLIVIIKKYIERQKYLITLLKNNFNIQNNRDVLELRGKAVFLNDKDWQYRRHGRGVEIKNLTTNECMDFDLNLDKNDNNMLGYFNEWSIQMFLEREYQRGELNIGEYKELYTNKDHFNQLFKQLIDEKIIKTNDTHNKLYYFVGSE